MNTSFLKKALPWLAPLAVIGLLAAGAILALWAMKTFLNISPFDTTSETRNTQVINSITREEQVVLLSLGIQGIEEKNESSAFFGINIPGSERAAFIQYTFDAKLGIEGEEVSIEQTGENEFLVSIPEFVFIGHDNEGFRLVAENNGALSGVTPEIDNIEMINNILNDDTKVQYIDANEAILKDQTRAFYNSIITSIDPTIVTVFEFR